MFNADHPSLPTPSGELRFGNLLSDGVGRYPGREILLRDSVSGFVPNRFWGENGSDTAHALSAQHSKVKI